MKLTADYIYVDQWMGVLPKEDFTIKIYCKEMSVGKALKKEILDSTRFFDKLKGMNFMESNNFIVPMETVIKYIDELKEKADERDSCIKQIQDMTKQHDEITSKLELQIKELKEEIEVLQDCSVDDQIENQNNEEIVDRLKKKINEENKFPEKRWSHKGVIHELKEILGESG